MKRLGDKGSVLVQMLLLSSLTVMIGAASMQMFLTNKEFAESELQSVQMMTLQNLVDSIFKDEVSCRRAIGAPPDYSTAWSAETWGPTPTPIPQTMTPDVNVSSEIRLYNAAQDVALITSEARDPGAAQARFGKLQIMSIALRPIYEVSPWLSTNTWYAQLTISARKTGVNPGSKDIVRNDVFLTVQLDGANRIRTCTSLSFQGTDARMPMPVCASDRAPWAFGGAITCARTVCPPTLRSTGTYNSTTGDIICIP